MIIRNPPPMSNLKRQRLFRQRHPDRDAIYKARHRAHMQAYRAQYQAAMEFVTAVMGPPPLALPAPVEVIMIPGLNAIPATSESRFTAEGAEINTESEPQMTTISQIKSAKSVVHLTFFSAHSAPLR